MWHKKGCGPSVKREAPDLTLCKFRHPDTTFGLLHNTRNNKAKPRANIQTEPFSNQRMQLQKTQSSKMQHCWNKLYLFCGPWPWAPPGSRTPLRTPHHYPYYQRSRLWISAPSPCCQLSKPHGSLCRFRGDDVVYFYFFLLPETLLLTEGSWS